MASLAPLLFLFALAACVGAATITTTNWCEETVYVAYLAPAGGGMELPRGQTFHLHAAAGSSGRVWGRTGCSFDNEGKGTCATGDCDGKLRCDLSGKPPATLAEFTIGDGYDISVADGFNLPMMFSCNTPGSGSLTCLDATCADGGKVYSCDAGNFHLVFCP